MTESGPLDIEAIRDILPHRYPFLLVDRVTEISAEGTIKGYKNVSVNEPMFTGHFPGKAVFPGVLIMEALAQLGAVMILRRYPKEQRMAFFAGIDKARFKRQVLPGDRMDLEVTLVRDRGSFVVMHGKASVDGQLAAEAEMMSALAK